MHRRILVLVALLLSILCLGSRERAARAQTTDATWRFAVSGDSRNCGDVVMPAIASSVLKQKPAFYWHLGDFRKVYDFDEDIQHRLGQQPMTISDYLALAWEDFIENQVVPFGSLPVFLGVGNHETVFPMTREAYLAQFADWLDTPTLQAQRLQDDPSDHRLKTYFHWVLNGVDFINLDNATPEQFDSAQVRWFERVLKRDASNPGIQAVVVGMHRALPDSISAGHSMNESPAGEHSGRRVYQDLLRFQSESHKRVYVLASHSHYFMEGIFNTEYWRAHGGVLPGWIIGTAGAERYPLPPNAKDARQAETHVYGYLLATVRPDGEIQFAFQHLAENDIPAEVAGRYTPAFVHWCFVENARR